MWMWMPNKNLLILCSNSQDPAYFFTFCPTVSFESHRLQYKFLQGVPNSPKSIRTEPKYVAQSSNCDLFFSESTSFNKSSRISLIGNQPWNHSLCTCIILKVLKLRIWCFDQEFAQKESSKGKISWHFGVK